MCGANPRSLPSRPTPNFDPVVEAWLDALPWPATKPSPQELKLWRLNNYHGLGRSVFVTCIIIRATSFAVAVSATGVIGSVVAQKHGSIDMVSRLVPVLVVCPLVALWNMAEFIAACLLADGGISPNIHVVADGVIFFGLAIAMGMLLVDVICGLVDFPSTFRTAPQEIAAACLLIVLMVIHSFLLFFFVCNYADKLNRRKATQAGGPWTPQYARVDTLGTGPRYAADKVTPLVTPVPFGPEQTATAVELRGLNPAPTFESPDFGISSHQTTPAPAGQPAVPLEHYMLAEAMAGLWEEGAESRYQARPPPRYGDPARAQVGQEPAYQDI